VRLLSERDAAFLRDKFATELDRPVTLRLYTMGASPLIVPGRDCATCEDTELIVKELSSLSDRVTVERHDYYQELPAAQAAGIARIPATVVAAEGAGRTVFYGVPAGYAFATLVEAVLHTGAGRGRLSDATRKALAAVSTPIHLQVFTTPT